MSRLSTWLCGLAVLGALAACGGGNPAEPAATAATTTTPDTQARASTAGDGRAAQLWLEPGGSTVIAAGQTIQLYAAYKATGSEPYPAYLDASQLSFSSSAPQRVQVSASGAVTGQAAGSATISVAYEGLLRTLTVQVSGTWNEYQVPVPGQGMRRYAIYSPPQNTRAARPAILSLHGGGGSANIQAATSQLVKLAQAQNVFVAFLEGTGAIATFNAGACCGQAATNGVDDVLYVRRVLDHLATQRDVDASRVYATGFSNGGMMSHRLACALADRFAGIAAVGGASGQFDGVGNSYYACTPARPIPVLHVHATNDRNYPYAGGFGDGLSDVNYYGVNATIADWRARNNVSAAFTLESFGASTVCRRHATAAIAGLPSAAVTLCRVDPVDVYDPVNEIVFGGGHSWPGGVRSPSPSSDTPLQDFDASAYLWDNLRR